MKRRIILAAALVLAPAGSALAQTAAGAAAAAAGGAADPGNNVTVTNKCCSIWDFLGAPGITKFLGNNVFKSVLGQRVAKLLSPVGKVLGLGPSLLSDKFAESDNPAMSLAAKAKKEEKDAPLKVKAIKYLGTLDCNCYPEVVDALLASLDDCNESVRIAALKALQGKCKTKSHCKQQCGSGLDCEPDDCCGCQCQKKVIEALNEHLLARDASGCLKERSQKVRDLATCMIEECLSRREPPPAEVAPAPIAEPPLRVVPDPTPQVKPEETPRPAPESASIAPKRSIFRKLFGSRSANPVAQEVVIEEVVIEEIVDATPAPQSVTRHSTGYRGLPASTPNRFEPVYIEPVLVRPTIDAPVSRPIESQIRTGKGASRSGRRHLFGEMFGY